MAVDMSVTEHGLVELRVTGKLSGDDYRYLVPRLEQLVHDHGRLRLLVELHDFHGWDLGGVWEELKFDARHSNPIERLAVVGQRPVSENMAAFPHPFSTSSVRYFDQGFSDVARDWLRGSAEARETPYSAEPERTPTGDAEPVSDGWRAPR
jgi:hypothetical protein